MGLHWGAPALRTMIGDEAWSRIQTIQVDPTTPTKPVDGLKFLNATTGEVINEAKIEYFYRLKRSALRKFLADSVDIRYGKKLVDVELSKDGKLATAKFEDGSSATGSLIVGADGPKSVVRNVLLGQTAALPKRVEYAATWVQARYTREQALHLRSVHPLFLGGVHPDGYFAFFGIQDASDAEHPENWLFFFYVSFKRSIAEQDDASNWTQQQHLAALKEKAKTFSDPWKSALEWLPEDHPIWDFKFAEWDPGLSEHKWDNRNGRMTLAGDAAHVMTVQRGQGLNHSLTDALQLLEAIKKSRQGGMKPVDAISEYEEKMITRAAEEVRLCTKNTAMLHNWELFLNSPVMKKGLNKG